MLYKSFICLALASVTIATSFSELDSNQEKRALNVEVAPSPASSKAHIIAPSPKAHAHPAEKHHDKSKGEKKHHGKEKHEPKDKKKDAKHAAAAAAVSHSHAARSAIPSAPAHVAPTPVAKVPTKKEHHKHRHHGKDAKVKKEKKGKKDAKAKVHKAAA